MALIAFPMESNFEGYNEHGSPIYDRAVGSVFYRTFWQKYFTDGIFREPSDNFKVTPGTGMAVNVKLGECHIKGVTAAPDDEQVLVVPLDASSPSSARTDRIVLRADFEGERAIYVAVRKDWKSTDSLTRNANIWELALADVLIRAGTVNIPSVDISDLRLNTELCGVVAEPIIRSNTQAFYTELTAEHARVKSEWNSQKASQQSTWQAQLNAQSASFNALDTSLKEWYASVRADLAKATAYDFDNLAFLAGCTRSVSFTGTTKVTETIKVTSTGRLIASRETTFSGSNVTSVTTVYDTDGSSILWKTTTASTIGTSITEVVTDSNV